MLLRGAPLSLRRCHMLGLGPCLRVIPRVGGLAWRLLWLLVGVRGSPLGQHWVRVGCVLLCVLGLPCLLPLLTLCVGGCRPSLASGVVFAGVCVGGYACFRFVGVAGQRCLRRAGSMVAAVVAPVAPAWSPWWGASVGWRLRHRGLASSEAPLALPFLLNPLACCRYPPVVRPCRPSRWPRVTVAAMVFLCAGGGCRGGGAPAQSCSVGSVWAAAADSVGPGGRLAWWAAAARRLCVGKAICSA